MSSRRILVFIILALFSLYSNTANNSIFGVGGEVSRVEGEKVFLKHRDHEFFMDKRVVKRQYPNHKVEELKGMKLDVTIYEDEMAQFLHQFDLSKIGGKKGGGN